MILKRIVPLPWARAIAVFAVVAALFGSMVSNLAFEYANYLLGLDEFGLGYQVDFGWIVVYGPILYGAFAFVCGLCGALVYNGCARLFGGIEFQLRPQSGNAFANGES